MERNEKLQALANYLGVEPNYFEEESYDDNAFESKEYNEEYLVLTEEEAREYTDRNIRNIFDDLGFESFTPSFQDWIIQNALDTEWFEDFLRESMEGYVENIEYESDDVFENRLIAEMFDNGILSEDNFENFGEDNPMLKDDVDIEDKKEEYIEYLIKSGDDPITYYRYNVGFNNLRDMVRKGYGPKIDMDAVVEECISQDGIAHFIASYDAKEINLGNGLFAYRTN
jgi:hypothetical protein